MDENDMKVGKLSSSELKSAILGMVLGDAYIDKHYKECKLDMYVDYRNHDYALFKYNILRQVGNLWVNIKEKVDNRPLKSGLTRKGWRIQTRIHPYITGIKDIPLFKKPEMLSALGLAVWFMDDGSISIRSKDNGFAGCYLAMCRYPIEFVEHCQETFYRNFNVRSAIQRSTPKRAQYLLRFRRSDTYALDDIVSPYIVPSMRYKLLSERRGKPNGLQDIV